MRQFQKMVSMARDAQEVKEEVSKNCGPLSSSAPVYPYGLCLSLGTDELDKLEITEKPEVGDTIHLFAMAKVTSVSENESENTDGERSYNCRIELQITDIAVESEDDENVAMSSDDRAKGRYGDKEAA